MNAGKPMAEDPRWRLLSELAAAAIAPRCPGVELTRRAEEYFALAAAIAADPAAAAGDRARARHILRTFERTVRANLPGLLAVLAKQPRDPNLSAEQRAEAADLLARAAEHLPAASDRRH